MGRARGRKSTRLDSLAAAMPPVFWIGLGIAAFIFLVGCFSGARSRTASLGSGADDGALPRRHVRLSAAGHRPRHQLAANAALRGYSALDRQARRVIFVTLPQASLCTTTSRFPQSWLWRLPGTAPRRRGERGRGGARDRLPPHRHRRCLRQRARGRAPRSPAATSTARSLRHHQLLEPPSRASTRPWPPARRPGAALDSSTSTWTTGRCRQDRSSRPGAPSTAPGRARVRSIGDSNSRVEDLERLQAEADGCRPSQFELTHACSRPSCAPGTPTTASPPRPGSRSPRARCWRSRRWSPSPPPVAEPGAGDPRWHLQIGNVVIPKSVTPSRIRENFDLSRLQVRARRRWRRSRLSTPASAPASDPSTFVSPRAPPQDITCADGPATGLRPPGPAPRQRGSTRSRRARSWSAARCSRSGRGSPRPTSAARGWRPPSTWSAVSSSHRCLRGCCR